MKLNVTTTVKMETDCGKFAIVKLVDKYKKGKIKCEKEFRVDLYKDNYQNGYDAIYIDNYNYIKNNLYPFLHDWCVYKLNCYDGLYGYDTNLISPDYDILKDDKEVYNYFKRCKEQDIFNFIVILEEAMLCGFIDDSPSLSIFEEFIDEYINIVR